MKSASGEHQQNAYSSGGQQTRYSARTPFIAAFA
jgi:hypothetical protein